MTLSAADPALTAFSKGQSVRAQEFLGSHPAVVDGQAGWTFRVWAPHAQSVAVMGDFNGWNDSDHPMRPLEGGIWEAFLPGLQQYDNYKYAVHTRDGRVLAKSDPYAFHAETRPGTASKLYDLSGYQWGDQGWMDYRKGNPIYQKPLNIYEVHLGSWRRTADDQMLSYRDIGKYLVPYVKEMGFTHVELLPVTEILDWVPAHFPKDAFGLYEFDGEPCYEYADPRKGEHADWGTRVFDYARKEVRSFLFSSALFWLEQYHVDGLRVDAVASMLYLDYGRQGGQWTPNVFGGHENLEAVDFLQQLNGHIFMAHPDVMMIAEESTAWPRVSHPVGEGGLEGGLGFNLKWNMGWMNDILHYIKLDPYFRQFNHKDITFSLMYAFSENFVLPLSHDEVVHMKGSLINKMPGTNEEKFAGVRVFYTYMLAHPGKKLLMMGTEFGQWNEWHFEHSLDWHLLDPEAEWAKPHRQLQQFFKQANALYLAHPELWELDFSWEGFEWIEANDNQANTVAFLRKDAKGDALVIVCNFSPVDRTGYTVGVPVPGAYTCIFSTDDPTFGGKGLGDTQPVKSQYNESQGKEQSITLKLPAMSAAIYRCTRKFPARRKKAEGTKTTKKAAKPAAKAKASAPAVKEKAPAPAVKKKASAPAAKEKAPAPAVKEKASAPAVKEKAPAPAVKEKASAPAVKEKTAAPQKKAEKKNATEKKGK